nr:glycoside hydrolase family 3 C-terminal domain-containing protein [Pyrinomonadaceae bacterium]
TPLDQIDQIVSTRDVEALANEIAARSITLVRNDNNLLPLDRTKKIAVLGISNGFDGTATMFSLVNTLRANGIKFETAYLQENSTADQIAAAKKVVETADIIIVGLYGRVRTGAKNSVGLPENGAAILRDLIAAKRDVVGVSFGNPYILGAFPEMKTYLVAYGDMSSLQRAAATAIVGGQDITGRLPISLPGLYTLGTGIQLKKN